MNYKNGDKVVFKDSSTTLIIDQIDDHSVYFHVESEPGDKRVITRTQFNQKVS